MVSLEVGNDQEHRDSIHGLLANISEIRLDVFHDSIVEISLVCGHAHESLSVLSRPGKK